MQPSPWLRWTIIAVVALHTALIAAYTLPEHWVPMKVRMVAQWYARPLFHQQWRLFAPDPPACSCTLQVEADGMWHPLTSMRIGHLQQRKVVALCRYVQAEVQQGRDRPSALLRTALIANAEQDPPPSMRLVQQCVVDPLHPDQREEVITELPLQ